MREQSQWVFTASVPTLSSPELGAGKVLALVSEEAGA